MTERTPMACPSCGAIDGLSTIEHLTGTAGVLAERDADGHVLTTWDGETDVDWDNSTTVGAECRCGWQARAHGPGWVAELVPAPAHDKPTMPEPRTYLVAHGHALWNVDGELMTAPIRTDGELDMANAGPVESRGDTRRWELRLAAMIGTADDLEAELHTAGGW